MIGLALIVGIAACVGSSHIEAKNRIPCYGCPRDIDPRNPELLKDLMAALVSINVVVDQPISIVRAQSQLVSGVKYIVDFLTGYGEMCHCSWTNQPWVSPKPVHVHYSCQDK